MGTPKKIPGRLRKHGITPEQYAEAKNNGLRWCSGHLRFEPIGNFWKSGGFCKESASERNKGQWKTFSEERRAFYNRHQKEPAAYERGRAYRKKRWDALSVEQRQELGRRNALKLRYKITSEEYDAKEAEQESKCAICRKPRGKKRLCVDHDHGCCPGREACGKCNRGLLCDECNFLVGLYESIVASGLISKIPEYLAHYSLSHAALDVERPSDSTSIPF